MAEATIRKRLDGIDVLRGLSIVAVVLHHINLRFLLNGVSFEQFLPAELNNMLFSNGANGVTVFFAISGFLITTTALGRSKRLDSIDVSGFYRLRFARIAPLLLALLAVLSVLHLLDVKGFVIAPERASLPRALFAAVSFHINWLESVRGYLPASWDVLWSLSVEEVFYLFFPLLCWFTRGRRALAVVLLGFVAIGPFQRTLLTSNEYWAECGYLSCMDAIAMGCLTAMLADVFRAGRRLLWGMRIVGALLILLLMAARPAARWLHLYPSGLDVTALALGTCLVLFAVAQQAKIGRPSTAPLRWFGRTSYEVYLTHMFVVMWGVQVYLAVPSVRVWAPAWFLGMLGLSGSLGAAVARFYSEPVNRRLRAGRQARRARSA